MEPDRLQGCGARISLSIDPVRVINGYDDVSSYLDDHEEEFKQNCSGNFDELITEDMREHVRTYGSSTTPYLVVYEEDGNAKGFAYALDEGDNNKPLYLFLLCADKGRGIGTILLNRIQDISRELKLPGVRLFPGDKTSENFYKKNGFVMPDEDDTNMIKKNEYEYAYEEDEEDDDGEVWPDLGPDDFKIGSGLPDRGSMFHAGLNRRS
jgi:GNAT superfamily N-acetyltransferase